jgi:hypothetical protein
MTDRSEYNKWYYQQHKEKLIAKSTERQKQCYDKDKDYFRLYSQAYRKTHENYYREYYRTNKAKYKKYKKKYYELHKDHLAKNKAYGEMVVPIKDIHYNEKLILFDIE